MNPADNLRIRCNCSTRPPFPLVESLGVPWVRSFSRKSRAFSGKSRAFLEKALLFLSWSSFSRLKKKSGIFRKSPTFSKDARVRSFSPPEQPRLKIHTGLSGTVQSYWVEKALLFPNWSSFSRQMPSRYVSKFRGFLAVCLYPFALKQTRLFISLIV